MMDLETETEMLETLARDLAAMPARISRARQIAQDAENKATAAETGYQVERGAHQAALDEAMEKHKAAIAKDKDEIARAHAAIAVERRELAEERSRVSLRESAAEQRAAFLQRKMSGAGA